MNSRIDVSQRAGSAASLRAGNVPAAGRAAARDVLLQAEIVHDEPTRATPPTRRLAALRTRAVRRLLDLMRIYRQS
jgi:hypothetical protein